MARMSKKRRQEIKELSEDAPDIFGFDSSELIEEQDDSILDLTMHPVHFLLMFALTDFKWIEEGTRLSYGEYLKDNVPRNGVVQSDGRILLEDLDGQPIVESLTHMGGAYSPASHGHTRKTSLGKARPSPNGWERIWVVLDSMGRSRIIKDVFIDNWESFGYSVEQLSDVEFLYGEIRRMGRGDLLNTPFMDEQLKQWRGRNKKGNKGGDTPADPSE